MRAQEGERVLEGITIERVDEGERGEYRAHVPGSPHVARLTWLAKDGARVANHTFTPSPLRGQGIAAMLVDALIADARAQGFRIVPACPYVEAAFRRHPEWADLKA
jgi:predicted GNAT family acetyltransferase